VTFLEHMLAHGSDAKPLAGVFGEIALGQDAKPILSDRGVTVGRRDAIEAVAKAFAKALERGRDPERLLVAGYRALGLTKDAAEAPKDSKRKRDTRGPLRPEPVR
jgi:hypothetical protein